MRSARGAVSLGAGELDLLCDRLGLDPPEGLGLGVGRTGPATADVRDGLAARGLLHGPYPVPPLASALRRLCRAPLTVDLRRGRPGPLVTVAALGTVQAVVAVRYSDGITVRRTPPERAVAGMLDTLSPLRPAPGRAVRVPVGVLTDALTAADDDPQQLVVELMRRGTDGPAARTLVAANHEVDALHRIGVTVRGPDGTRTGPYRITIAHTASGHHYQRPCPGPPDELVAGPATVGRLTREIDDLIDATAGRPLIDEVQGVARPGPPTRAGSGR